MATDKKYLFAGTQSGAWRIPLSDVATSVKVKSPDLPIRYALFQNYPNPFNPTTVISYQLSAVSKVTLIIYDVLGREVAILVNGVRQPGNYAVEFNGTNLASGVYFCRLQAGDYKKIMKMILLK